MSKPVLQRRCLARRISALGALFIVATLSAGCFCPFIFYDAAGGGVAWKDLDCNGVKDPDEQPLAGVCMWSSEFADDPTPSAEECASESFQTDSEGLGGGFFYSGVSCNDVFVFAQAPEGYDATTDTVANDSCWNEFGFAPEGTCPPASTTTPEELVAEMVASQRRNRCLAWGLLLGLCLGPFVLAYCKHRSESRPSASREGE